MSICWGVADMGKLLSAALLRLRKSWVFWGCLAATVICSNFVTTTVTLSGPDGETEMVMGNHPLGYVMFLGLALAVFCSLFLGVEYADGTIRNKLIAGHTRSAVYLSNLAVCTGVGWAMCAVSLTVGLARRLILGDGGLEAAETAFAAAGTLLLAFAYAALFTLLAMLLQSRSASAVACLLLALGLLVVGIALYGMLMNPESYPITTILPSGEMVMEEIPNPSYVGEPLRAVYEFLLDATPGGQSIQVIAGSLAEHGRPWLLPLSSLVVGAAATAAGVLAFCPRDIK